MERYNPERNRTLRSEIAGFHLPVGLGLLLLLSALDIPPDTSIPATIGILAGCALERKHGR